MLSTVRTMDSPSNEMRIETSLLEDGRLARVVYIFPGGSTPTFMLVALQDLDEALETLREAGRNAQTAEEEEHPIPESMLADCVLQVGDTCSICLEEAELCPEAAPWVSLLRCQHRFHAHCIRQWPRSVCPYCREDYDETSPSS